MHMQVIFTIGHERVVVMVVSVFLEYFHPGRIMAVSPPSVLCLSPISHLAPDSMSLALILRTILYKSVCNSCLLSFWVNGTSCKAF